MSDREPTETTNLDRYGNEALEWSRVHDILAAGPFSQEPAFFLGTLRPDGRPHSAGVGAAWHDGDFYVVSGPGTRKSRNLAANPAATISARLKGIDLIFDCAAARVTYPETLRE